MRGESLFARDRSMSLMVGLLLAGAVGATPAAAQNPDLQGSYEYVPAESENVDAAIDKGVSRMSFLTRGIARGRLKKTNVPYEKVAIAYTPSEVTITTDSRAPIVTSAAGDPIQWRREDGEMFDVSTVWDGDKLKQTFVADDGQRENTFTWDPQAKRMLMTVTVQSKRLPEPVVYTLVYRRAS